MLLREDVVTLRRLVVALALFAVLAATSNAQTPPTGSVSGTVSDISGGVFPGVTVTLSGAIARQTTTTNSSGRFRFERLEPGTYRLEATLRGFVTEPKNDVVVGDREVTV